ncbi:MAG TPA: hypothetical protein VHX62_15775 [Solirubrobacteraceae bacterium]|nr:hypothetical protein [Solirubrobacteraceae bacterium]
MEAASLQWSGAEVRDGVLTVRIDGDRPKGFKPAFARTVTLLGGGPVGVVALKGATVRVRDVDEGSEETLHHFLESVLQEVNTALAPDDSGDGQPADDADDADDAAAAAAADDDDDDDDDDDPDARMTERFRSLSDA